MYLGANKVLVWAITNSPIRLTQDHLKKAHFVSLGWKEDSLGDLNVLESTRVTKMQEYELVIKNQGGEEGKILLLNMADL